MLRPDNSPFGTLSDASSLPKHLEGESSSGGSHRVPRPGVTAVAHAGFVGVPSFATVDQDDKWQPLAPTPALLRQGLRNGEPAGDVTHLSAMGVLSLGAAGNESGTTSRGRSASCSLNAGVGSR